jgi:hypothetical protein
VVDTVTDSAFIDPVRGSARVTAIEASIESAPYSNEPSADIEAEVDKILSGSALPVEARASLVEDDDSVAIYANGGPVATINSATSPAGPDDDMNSMLNALMDTL